MSKGNESNDRVPLELKQWFAGKSLVANRFGLPRLEVRIRVVELIGVLGTEVEPYVIKGAPMREFKTKRAAERYAKRREQQGVNILIQYAPVIWLTDGEIPNVERSL